MMEERHDGMTQGPDWKGKPLSVADLSKLTQNVYQKMTPEWKMLVMLDLLKSTCIQLRDYVQTDKAGIFWANPFAQMEYEVALVEEGPPTDRLDLKHHNAYTASDYRVKNFPDFSEPTLMQALTRKVLVRRVKPLMADGRFSDYQILLPSALSAEVDGLPESEREVKLAALALGVVDFVDLKAAGTVDTPTGRQTYAVALVFAVRPLSMNVEEGRAKYPLFVKEDRAFYPIQIGLNFTEGDPADWSEEDREALFTQLLKSIDDLAAPYLKEYGDHPRLKPTKADRINLGRAEAFAVAGSYVRPIFGLSKNRQDLPLLREFYEPQTQLNWAVGLVMFSLTDEDKVRSGDFQEASIRDIEDRVFCLIERDADRRGDHRTDILAEVVKLHTMRNWYYEVDTVRVGRAWKKRVRIGSQYAIPELELVFIDTKTGKRTFPTDAAVRMLAKPLEVKGRRVAQPDGKDIPALPKDRWKLDSIRWRWVQAFNEDLLLTPALEESGKRKDRPKKTTTGKTIRKGYMIPVVTNIFTALHRLRVEGPRSEYACRLLVMLAHNLHKTESGIAADRVFRMLGIPEDYTKTTHRKPEDLVAAAVFRLKQRDIGALLPGSDETPRTDPNPDRRMKPYYRFIRSLDYTPRTGITSKEDALTIEAEYAEDAAPVLSPALPSPKTDQAILPGMEEQAPPIPSGADIRAAREAAGLNLRDFARMVDGPAFKTWQNYETGHPIRVNAIKPDAWHRVRDFVAKHGGKGSA